MSRSFRIALLVFETLWFGVLVPWHTRGQIALPGDTSSRSTCCDRPSARHDSEPVQKHTPRSRTCAVCQFIATLDLPPQIVLEAPRLGLTRQIAPLHRERQPAMPLLWRCDLARAPPACFV